MNAKALLTTTIRITTGLVIVTLGSISLLATLTTTTQTLGQEAAVNNNNSNTKTKTTTDSAGGALYNLTINNRAHPIKLNITGGILDTISVDGDQAILLVGVNASIDGGKLTIELPRDLIDSKTQSNADKPYLVYEDDIDRSITFIESNTTEKAKTLVITFNDEDDVIEIQGTEVLSKPSGEF
jgi:hypothetical protein